MMTVINKLAWVHIRDRKVLLVRSKGNALFYLPGGKPEEGENDFEALSRETEEELGVRLIPETSRYLRTLPPMQADGKPEGTPVQIKCFGAECIGEPHPASEIEEAGYFSGADYARTTVAGRYFLRWLVRQGLID